MHAHHASTAPAGESEREMESKIDLFEVQFHPLCFPLSCLYLQRWRGVESLQGSLHVRRGQKRKIFFFFNISFFFFFAKLRDELHTQVHPHTLEDSEVGAGRRELTADSPCVFTTSLMFTVSRSLMPSVYCGCRSACAPR